VTLSGAPPDPLFLSFQLALAGRYSIDRELGRGGMGIVYLAREVHLDRPVAIKLLPPDRADDPALRERFLREARLAAKLSHPNVIPIHAVDETEGFVYYVMAFVDGVTLTERVRLRGPVSGSEGTRLLREVSWALAYAHDQGVVHRDVKPDNVLIESGSGRALVADFGIAAAAGDQSGAVTGTPEFMSPEQALGGAVDARSDLYSLGVTGFFAFSGRIPFDGATPTEILAKQVTEPAPPLGSIGATIPRAVAAVIDRCLAKSPDQRPASAHAVADQLGVALEQRRELPAALRAFVKRTGRIDGGGTLIYASGLLLGSAFASILGGVTPGFGTLVLGSVGVPFAYLVAVARKLMRQGFTHADLAPAFQAEIEQAREERAAELAWAPPRLIRALGSLGKVTFVVGIGAFTAGWSGLQRIFGVRFDLVFLFTFSTAIGSTLLRLALLQRKRDVDTDFWASIWLGRIGKSAFALARRLIGKRPVAAAMTHRATELSLGLAAEQLYEALPKATRHALGEVPQLLTRLQQDATVLRRRYDELATAVGPGDGPDETADLRADRDQVHQRLTEAVAALETIRLGLLRLHADAATLDGFTTQLRLATDVSVAVGRLIDARRDLDRSLGFSPAPTPTPV
jgi:serine/threonine-protein kinase